jgi:hypothetical protein
MSAKCGKRATRGLGHPAVALRVFPRIAIGARPGRGLAVPAAARSRRQDRHYRPARRLAGVVRRSMPQSFATVNLA